MRGGGLCGGRAIRSWSHSAIALAVQGLGCRMKSGTGRILDMDLRQDILNRRCDSKYPERLGSLIPGAKRMR
jgi:hypothetical protein